MSSSDLLLHSALWRQLDKLT